jgi:hypothetical protein
VSGREEVVCPHYGKIFLHLVLQWKRNPMAVIRMIPVSWATALRGGIFTEKRGEFTVSL